MSLVRRSLLLNRVETLATQAKFNGDTFTLVTINSELRLTGLVTVLTNKVFFTTIKYFLYMIQSLPFPLGGHPSWVGLNHRPRGRLRLGQSVMFVLFPF